MMDHLTDATLWEVIGVFVVVVVGVPLLVAYGDDVILAIYKRIRNVWDGYWED